MLPYYRITEKSDECRQFINSHTGIFNLFGKLLILNIAQRKRVVLADRTGSETGDCETSREKSNTSETIKEEFAPPETTTNQCFTPYHSEEMYTDFPEILCLKKEIDKALMLIYLCS